VQLAEEHAVGRAGGGRLGNLPPQLGVGARAGRRLRQQPRDLGRLPRLLRPQSRQEALHKGGVGQKVGHLPAQRGERALSLVVHTPRPEGRRVHQAVAVAGGPQRAQPARVDLLGADLVRRPAPGRTPAHDRVSGLGVTQSRVCLDLCCERQPLEAVAIPWEQERRPRDRMRRPGYLSERHCSLQLGHLVAHSRCSARVQLAERPRRRQRRGRCQQAGEVVVLLGEAAVYRARHRNGRSCTTELLAP
jgi:hypothetical protein